jgi:hypothetical protein
LQLLPPLQNIGLILFISRDILAFAFMWYGYCSIWCSKELMYQQALCRFGNFNAIQLSEPAPLRELLLMALKDDELMGDENDEEKLEIAEVSCFPNGSILC